MECLDVQHYTGEQNNYVWKGVVPFGAEIPCPFSYLQYTPSSTPECGGFRHIPGWCGQVIFPMWVDGVIDRAKGTRT